MKLICLYILHLSIPYVEERYSGLSEKQYEHIVREVVEKYQTGKLQIEEVPDNYPWNFPNTFFFVITALSTIGQS